MELDFTIVSLPGNPINLTNYITIEPSQVYYTASNWSTEVVLLVDGTSESTFSSIAPERHGVGSRVFHLVRLLYVQMAWHGEVCSAPMALAGTGLALSMLAAGCCMLSLQSHTAMLRLPAAYHSARKHADAGLMLVRCHVQSSTEPRAGACCDTTSSPS